MNKLLDCIMWTLIALLATAGAIKIVEIVSNCCGDVLSLMAGRL